MKNLESIENVNKITDVFVCYNEDETILYFSAVETKAKQYAKKHNCEVSAYPIGTFTQF